MKHTAGISRELAAEAPKPGPPEEPVIVGVVRVVERVVEELEVTPTSDANDVAEAGVVNIVAVISPRDEVASNRSEAYTVTVVVVVALE
jgi:hypothetical protein